LTFILRIEWWSWRCLVCIWKLPIRRGCITPTRSLFNDCTYKTTNRWHCVNAHCILLSIQHQLPSIIVFIMIWTHWMSFSQIKTLPYGKPERSNILARFAPTWLEFIYLAKRFIAPAIHLFINQYSQATAHRSPIIYLQLKLSVKLHKEAGETLTHSVQPFLRSLVPPRFYCIDHHKHLFSLALEHPGWPNQSGIIWGGIHIPLLWAFRILNAIALLHIRLNVCHSIFVGVIWIVQVAIPL